MTMNNSNVLRRFFVALLCLAFFSYGLLVGVYKIFPFEHIQSLKNLFKGDNVCLHCGANTHWSERLQQFRIFPSEAVNVFVGDSITHVGHWAEIFPTKSVLNRGIGWDKSTDILARIDTVLSAKPKRVFLMFGVNDFNLANRSVDAVFSTYIQIVNSLLSENIEVVIQSTIECANCGETTSKIRHLNSMLLEFSDRHNLVFIDLNSSMSDEFGLKREYQQDGVHPNAEGYRVWSEMVKGYLL